MRSTEAKLLNGSKAALAAAWTVLQADRLCKGDLVFHLNANQTLTRQLELRDLLWLGKPMLVYRSHAALLAADPSAAKDAAARAAGTAHALGDAPPAELDFRIQHLRVYPRELHARARRHVEAAHGGADLAAYLRAAAAAPGSAGRKLDPHDVLGTFAIRHAPEMVSLVPTDASERKALLLPPPLFRPPLLPLL